MTEARAISDGRQSDLAGLIERVREAKGSDRRLEIDLWRTLDGGEEAYAAGKMPLLWLANYTESIDAALGLVDRLLPEWSHANGNVGEHDIPWACLTEPVEPCRDFAASAVTEPIAILAALLSALSQTEKQS